MVWSFWTWKCVQDQSQNALIWNLASDITMICSVWWFAYLLHLPFDSKPISLLFLHSCWRSTFNHIAEHYGLADILWFLLFAWVKQYERLPTSQANALLWLCSSHWHCLWRLPMRMCVFLGSRRNPPKSSGTSVNVKTSSPLYCHSEGVSKRFVSLEQTLNDTIDTSKWSNDEKEWNNEEKKISSEIP